MLYDSGTVKDRATQVSAIASEAWQNDARLPERLGRLLALGTKFMIRSTSAVRCQ